MAKGDYDAPRQSSSAQVGRKRPNETESVDVLIDAMWEAAPEKFRKEFPSGK